MRSILLHVSDEATLAPRLESALAVARCFGAHLRCLQITPLEAYVAFDGLGGVFVMNDILRAIEEQQGSVRALVERELANEDVSWDFQQTTGSIAYSIASYAALADLVVSGRTPPGSPAEVGDGSIADIVQQSRTPLLVPAGSGTIVDPTAPALIAWDRSFEAAQAIKDALPLLRLAGSVTVATVEEEREEPDSFPGTAVLEYLSRHDVHAELRQVPGSRHEAAAILLREAEQVGARTLVAGAYHHSRVGEFWLGGVTRTLLHQCPLALVLSR